MSERTCEIDGEIFEGIPCNEAAGSMCQGCVGDGNPNVCAELADCLRDKIIWVVKV